MTHKVRLHATGHLAVLLVELRFLVTGSSTRSGFVANNDRGAACSLDDVTTRPRFWDPLSEQSTRRNLNEASKRRRLVKLIMQRSTF